MDSKKKVPDVPSHLSLNSRYSHENDLLRELHWNTPDTGIPTREGRFRKRQVHSHSDRPASSDVHSLVRRLFDSPEPPTGVASAAAADARDAEPPGADAAAAGAAWGAAVPGRMSPEARGDETSCWEEV